MTVNTLPTSAEVISGTQTNADQKTDFASMFDFLLSRLGSKSGQGPQTVASAATLNLDAITETRDIVISGTTPITAVTVEAGKVFRARASGAFSLVDSSAIVTNRSSDILCAAGDSFLIRATAANTVEILFLSKASLTLRTAIVAAGQTEIAFPNIPSFATKITMTWNSLSSSGTSPLQVQGGDSGGYETSGYSGTVSAISTAVVTNNISSGFDIDYDSNASYVRHGSITLVKNDSGANGWVANGSHGLTTGSVRTTIFAGSKTLSATLDRIRLRPTNGTDTFDNGVVNIVFE